MTSGTKFYPGVSQLEAMEEAENYNNFLLELLIESISPKDNLLDFGAGFGFFAKRMQALGFQVDCLEPDVRLADELANLGFTVIPAFLPRHHQSYDAIYCLNVLEHIEDDMKQLRSMSAALKPGGQLVLYVPAFPILFSSMDRAVGHLRRYRLKPLAEMVRRAGFEVQHAFYTDALGFVAALLYLLTDPGDGSINRRLLKTYDRLFFPLSKSLDRVCFKFVGKNICIKATRAPESLASR